MTTHSPALRSAPLALPAAVRRHAPVAALLGLTALLYLWGLGRNGWANQYYAAAVRAGSESWKALLFGSFDSSSYITVDKPPAALWPMELSVHVFGWSSWSMLVPQALAGVASVALLSATIRRWFGTGAGLLAGAILALTPVAAVMFRFNNPDALLVLLLVAAGWALTRALERAGTWWLVLAGSALGLAFLTKLLQAFLVLPAFALVYVVAAPAPLRRRLWQTLVAGVAIVVAGGWWVALVELWPAASRPYIGGSTTDSILQLTLGYDGLGRLNGGGGANFSGTPGLLRLFDVELGGQISWLVPAALVALVYGLVRTLRAPRTDRTRAALLLWGGWLVASGLVYSTMAGGIHPYYTNTLAPAVAACVAVGGTLLWRERASLAARLVLAAGVVATAAWSYWLLERTPDWHRPLHVAVLVVGLAAAAAIVILGDVALRPVAATLAAAALFAVLAGPTAYTLGTAATTQNGGGVTAGPAVAVGFGGPGGESADGALTALLKQDAGSYTWVAATSSANGAAPYEIATGLPVMALGGFNGGDSPLTLAQFEALVAAKKIHYWIDGGGFGGLGGPGGFGRGRSSEIASWIQSTFTAQTVGNATVYDLTRG